MALKNLFDMVKADRYTADGREELIKAQEAETEDKVYQIGEISQKTGLQKTANGWVKPKNGKQPGAKKQNAPTGSKKIDYQVTEKGGKFYATGHQFSDGSQLHAGPFGSEKELHEFMNGSPYKSTAESKPGTKKEEPKNVHGAEVDKIYERQLKRIKELKAKGFTDEQIDNDKIIKQTKEDMKNVGKKPENKPAAQEVKLGGGADTYYFEDPDNMSNEDKVFKSLGIELAETFGDHDGDPGNVETWANAWLDNTQNEGGLGIKSKKTRQPAAPVPAEEVMKIVEENPARWNRIIGNAKKFYEGKGNSTDFESDEHYPIKLVGGKTKPSAQYYAEGKRNKKNNPLTGSDSAPSLSEIVDRVYNIGEISEKTGLQKTANGWRPVKKGAAGKTSRANKEEAIRKDLGLTEGEDMSRFSDEQIEKMYAKTQQTPEQQKADFDKSKIGQAVNKGRQEFAAEKTRQKELASKTNAIGLPKESKPAAPVKRNEAETVKHSDGTESYRIKGTQFYFKTPEEAESALLTESRYGKSYATASKDPEINNIQEALGFKLDMLGSGKSMDKFMKKIGENEYAANVWGFGTDSKGTLITPLDETDKPNSVIKKENGEWKLHYKDRNGKETVVTANGRQDPTRDSAPRVLTGDCRIRIRKEKPALTGDTRIRVRK